MADILDGTIPSEEIRTRLAAFIKGVEKKPCLAILQVGDRSDSAAYIRRKKQFADVIGATIIHKTFPETVTESELIAEIQKYNNDSSVHGILLQIPIPKTLDKEKILEAIVSHKDIDGLGSKNIKALFDGTTEHAFVPATSRGVISLLDYYKITISGKHAVIVGRSSLVGKPTALAFLNRDATVTIAHKETVNLREVTKSADILVVAIGDPEFINKEYVKAGQIVIDIGINPLDDKKVKGDVKRKEVEGIVQAVTPVPGGVGPMTVASLFENLIDAYKRIELNK